MYEIAKAIAIPQLKSITKQYSLNNISFDPIQNSPPSLWKMRLNKRIGDNPLKQPAYPELCAKFIKSTE
jgi:hypothetical protein